MNFKLGKNTKIPLYILILGMLVYTLIILTSTDIFETRDIFFGTTAKLMIDGNDISFNEYSITDNRQGSIIEGIVLIPFFLLFGDHGILLKFVNLPILLLFFILVYYFMNTNFGYKSAVISLLLFIFAPVTFLRWSLVVNTHVFHSTIYLLAIFIIFQKLIFNREIPHFMLFGFISGLFITLNYVSLIGVMSCFFVLIIKRRRLFNLKNLSLFLILFLLGISPLIHFELTSHRITRYVNRWFIEDTSFEVSNYFISALIKVKKILFENFLNSFQFGYFSEFNYIYYILSIIALIYLLKNNLSKFKVASTLILTSFVLHILFFILSNFPLFYSGPLDQIHDINYFMPLILFSLLSIAVLISRMKNKLFILFIFIFISMGVTNIVSLVSFEKIDYDQFYAPYCYQDYGINLRYRFEVFFPDTSGRYVPEKICNKLNKEIKDDCIRGTNVEIIPIIGINRCNYD